MFKLKREALYRKITVCLSQGRERRLFCTDLARALVFLILPTLDTASWEMRCGRSLAVIQGKFDLKRETASTRDTACLTRERKTHSSCTNSARVFASLASIVLDFASWEAKCR